MSRHPEKHSAEFSENMLVWLDAWGLCMADCQAVTKARPRFVKNDPKDSFTQTVRHGCTFLLGIRYYEKHEWKVMFKG